MNGITWKCQIQNVYGYLKSVTFLHIVQFLTWLLFLQSTSVTRPFSHGYHLSYKRKCKVINLSSYVATYRFLTFTTQQAKGVTKSDPETMRGFTGVEFSPGEMYTQTVTNRRTKKRPFPHTLSTVGGSEKVTLGQLNPQRPARTDIKWSSQNTRQTSKSRKETRTNSRGTPLRTVIVRDSLIKNHLPSSSLKTWSQQISPKSEALSQVKF